MRTHVAAEDSALEVLILVYSLPDGHLQAANESARSLLGLEAATADPLHARDIIVPFDTPDADAALSALASGSLESYRTERTHLTADGPLILRASVRRLLVASGALAVALVLPDDVDETSSMQADDPLDSALVAGTIDGNGVITSLSSSSSIMETELAGSLSGELRQAVHPDDADRVDEMLASLHLRGDASGTCRFPHAEKDWLTCQCQLFTIDAPGEPGSKGDPGSTTDSSAGQESFVFVLSASDDAASMVDQISKLERHISRIGSEVLAAGIELLNQPPAVPGMAAVLDTWELTARQRNIVERLARGQRIATIAAELYISRSTVRNHLARVYRRADVHSQEELLDVLPAS